MDGAAAADAAAAALISEGRLYRWKGAGLLLLVMVVGLLAALLVVFCITLVLSVLFADGGTNCFEEKEGGRCSSDDLM